MQKKENKPLVSVVMPAYNSEKTIARAIESILNQTYKNFEFIIINDGSTDKTLEIIREYAKKDKRIIVLDNKKNMKIVYSLNKGIEKARGKYIARMDSDDFSFPERFEKQIEFMEKNPDVGIVGSNIILSENGETIGYKEYSSSDKKIRENLIYHTPIIHPSAIIRKTILERTGLYNPKYTYAEDYELFLRIGKISKFANIPKMLLQYNISEGNITSKHLREEEIKAFKIKIKYRKEYNLKFIKILLCFFILVFYLIIPQRIIRPLFGKIRNIILNGKN